MKKKYRAIVKYSRSYDVEIEADSLEEAENSAQVLVNQEDETLDINEREWLSLIGVEEITEGENE